MLPLLLQPCPTCGFEIPFNRGFMWISKKFIAFYAESHHSPMQHPAYAKVLAKTNQCSCPENCPVCYPENNDLKKYGFMWVGSRDYTPASFVKEARDMGISKKIAKIPKGLKFGKTWVLLAHRKVPFSSKFQPEGMRTKEPELKSAIFYAFVPRRVEKLIWKSKATKRRLNKLKKQGITPVVIPDNDKDHAPKPKKC